MVIKCFFIEPTDKQARYLRRYSDSKCPASVHAYSCHDQQVRVEDGPATTKLEGNLKEFISDSRWPRACECGYLFTDRDAKQVFQDIIYKRLDTGVLIPMREAPAGAMYYAEWEHHRLGPDGKALCVKTPGGIWMVDQRAKNCGLPNDDTHRCWVRHGDPRTGMVTVDKNGVTCVAGAGSIQCGSYHGFLRNGELVEC